MPDPTARAARAARRRALPIPLAALAALALLLGAACSGPSMAPVETDPGIGATLAIVRGQTGTLLDTLERDPGLPYEQAEPIHYRPLLDELGKAQRLARLHDRSAKEQQALAALRDTYEALRTLHREGRIRITDLRDYRTRLERQLDALTTMELR